MNPHDSQWWLDRASIFRIDFNDTISPVEIQQFRQTTPPAKWGVVCGDRVLNMLGKWEYHPRPSSRDDAFLSRCRFSSKEIALKAYINWKERNPDTHPETVAVTFTTTL